MGGAKFPAWGKSKAVAKSVGAPTEAEAQSFRPRQSLVSGAPKTRTSFHTNGAMPRGHTVNGRMKGC
jgi:hypothetical protein